MKRYKPGNLVEVKHVCGDRYVCSMNIFPDGTFAKVSEYGDDDEYSSFNGGYSERYQSYVLTNDFEAMPDDGWTVHEDCIAGYASAGITTEKGGEIAAQDAHAYLDQILDRVNSLESKNLQLVEELESVRDTFEMGLEQINNLIKEYEKC